MGPCALTADVHCFGDAVWLLKILFTFVSPGGQRSLVLPSSVPLKVAQQLVGLLHGQTVQAATETVYISVTPLGGTNVELLTGT